MVGAFNGTNIMAAPPGGGVSRSGVQQLQQEVYRQGLGGGHGQFIGSTGPVSVTPEQVVIYGIIRDDEDGSGAGSGNTFSGVDAGFIAPDGYTAYAFDEVNPV